MTRIRKEIRYSGELVGYKLYAEGGLFGCLTFVGYEWL